MSDAPPLPVRRGYLRVPRRPVFAACAVLLVLLACEGVARLAEWRRAARSAARERAHYSLEAATRDGTRFTSEAGTIRLQLDPDVGLRLAPGRSAPGIAINSLGLRGPERPRERAPGTLRLILTGGSVAFGWGASSDAATIAARLEALLGTPERPVEVWNAGCPAYTATQEQQLLGTVLLELEPDLVVSLTGFNDLHDDYTGGGLVGNEVFAQVERRLVEGYRLGPALLHSSALTRRLLRDRAVSPGTEPARAPSDAARRRFRRALRNMNALAPGALLVALQPAYLAHDVARRPAEERARVDPGVAARDAGEPGRYAAFTAATLAWQRELLGELERAGAATVDLSAAFAGDDEPVFTDPCHLTDAGNERLARRLAEAVRAHPAWRRGAR